MAEKLYILRPYERFNQFLNDPKWCIVSKPGKFEVGDHLRVKTSPSSKTTIGWLEVTGVKSPAKNAKDYEALTAKVIQKAPDPIPALPLFS